MISNISKIAVFTLVLFMLNACISPPSFPPTPRIEFRSFSDTIVNQLESFDIVIYFEDGDGDLGSDFSDPAACTNPCLPETVDTSCFNNSLFNIFAVDDRTGCILASGAIIPDVPAKGSTNAISGEMIISVGPVCCFDRIGGQGGCVPLPNFPRDSLTFKIRIRDKAGNFSNELSVGPVFINCN